MWPIAVAATIGAQWPWRNLADDVRFTFGALRTADVDWPALEAFAHRPMGNRLVMAGVDHLTGGPLPLREKLIMSIGVIMIGIAAGVLHLALRRRTGSVLATAVTVAVFLSLAWASEPYFWQPEWTATVLGVAVLGLMLITPRTAGTGRILLGVAAVLLALAVLQKYSTITVAGLVIIVVWLVDRRRAVLLATFGAAATVILFGLTVLLGSHEWQWFLETPKLNPSVGLRWDAFGEWAVNVGFNNPVLLAWPAGAALAAALSGRRHWVVASVLGFGGTMAVIIAQNQFFSYHGTPLLPAAAAVVAYAGTRWVQRKGTLPWGIVPLVVWLLACTVILRWPAEVRSGSRHAVGLGLLLVTIVVASLSWLQSTRPSIVEPVERPRAIRAVAAAAILGLVLTFPAWPATPYGLFGLDRSRRSEVVRQQDLITELAGVRDLVGDGPVAYLADGETVYFVGAPTPCRYAPAVVLYRSHDPVVGGLRSFTENLQCLTDPTARFLVWQLWRAPVDEIDPRINEAIQRTYDCGPAAQRVGEILVCPRRGAG